LATFQDLQVFKSHSSCLAVYFKASFRINTYFYFAETETEAMRSNFSKEKKRVLGESQEVLHGWDGDTTDRHAWAIPGVPLALEKFI